jgi:hypothetical protein
MSRLIEDPAGSAGSTGPDSGHARPDAGSRYLLEGSASFETNKLHITARLTDVRQNAELWSNRYDAQISDAPVIADDIASHTARAVARDRETIVESAPSPYPGGPRAARELVALGHQIDYYSPGANPSTQQIYRLAWQFDKNDAVVLTHLANSDIRAGLSHVPEDRAPLEEADATLRQAIELDPRTSTRSSTSAYCAARKSAFLKPWNGASAPWTSIHTILVRCGNSVMICCDRETRCRRSHHTAPRSMLRLICPFDPTRSKASASPRWRLDATTMPSHIYRRPWSWMFRVSMTNCFGWRRYSK